MHSKIVNEIINGGFLNQINEFAVSHQTAKPFPHVCIDHFFTREFLGDLEAGFPEIGNDMGRKEGAPGGAPIS